MKITGLTLQQFMNCTMEVSNEKYGGNIVVHQDARDNNGVRKPRCQGRLKVLDSRGPGARTSASGRHGPFCCWHGYRNVLVRVFELYPDAVIWTGIGKGTVYRGRAGFEATYPATARVNMGSQWQPVTMPEMCECRETPVTAETTAAAAENDLSQPRDVFDTCTVPRPAVVNAAEAYERSMELLGEKPEDHIDEMVFGPQQNWANQRAGY